MATTITSSGNLLNIDRNGKINSYAKEGISIKVKTGSYLSIRFQGREIQLVRESERAAVTPASSSLADLQTKIDALFPVSTGGNSSLPVVVATYEDAVPLFTGSVFKRINVTSDSAYNADEDTGVGQPSFYEYRPEMPEGKKVFFLGLDNNYLNNV